MLNYIWLDDTKPILTQVKDKFRFAYIITNPLILMSDDWIKKHGDDETGLPYPSGKEVIKYGKPMLWSEVIKVTGLNDFESLALAMKTYISALNKDFARNDLMEIFKNELPDDVYLPNEDKISPFIIPTIIDVLRSSGTTNKLQYSDPIFDVAGELSLDSTSILDIYELAPSEVILTDEANRVAFMSVYDSFITLMLSNDPDAIDIVINSGWEVIECTSSTRINWYLQHTFPIKENPL